MARRPGAAEVFVEQGGRVVWVPAARKDAARDGHRQPGYRDSSSPARVGPCRRRHLLRARRAYSQRMDPGLSVHDDADVAPCHLPAACSWQMTRPLVGAMITWGVNAFCMTITAGCDPS